MGYLSIDFNGWGYILINTKYLVIKRSSNDPFTNFAKALKNLNFLHTLIIDAHNSKSNNEFFSLYNEGFKELLISLSKLEKIEVVILNLNGNWVNEIGIKYLF